MFDVKLINEARTLINQGVYDPEQLFRIIYNRNRVHYSKVREAVNYAKSR